MSSIWYSADPHFGHKNIIKYSDRPFASVEEMDETILRNYVEAFKPGDQFFCLGDWAFKGGQRALDRILETGVVATLILGNHDTSEADIARGKTPSFGSGWSEVRHYKEVRHVDQNGGGDDLVVCAHYGMRVWNGSHRGSYMLYGHTHGTLPPIARSIDVGVDVWGFRPVTLDMIKTRLASLGLDTYETPAARE